MASDVDLTSDNLIASMIKNPRDIATSTQLLFSFRNLEHIIGYSVNIDEVVHFVVTGELFPLEQRNLTHVSD